MRWRILTEENNKKAAATHQQYNRQTSDNIITSLKNNEEASTKLAEQFYDGRISWGSSTRAAWTSACG
jgi:hypothetical protein